MTILESLQGCTLFMTMSSLNVRSHNTQLALVAVISSLATAGAFTAYNTYSRRRRRQQLREDIRDALAREELSNDSPEIETPGDGSYANLVQERVEPVKERILRGEHPEELFREQLARCYALFKEEGMERIRNARVVVVGCGGVGSWAAVMLVRSCVWCMF